MRTSEIDILIAPGRAHGEHDHWLARWQRNLKTARLVEQGDWGEPELDAWADRIVAEAQKSRRPAILIAHDIGVIAVAQAAERLMATMVAGAFLVAPPGWSTMEGGTPAGFAPVPMQVLPFPTKLIGSSTDPHCSVERLQEIGAAWGSDVSVIANAGHLDVASGHGPWPEGLLTFGLFLKKLG